VVNPSSDWETRYHNWPRALKKLTYVAELIEKNGRKRPNVGDGPDCYNVLRMRSTLNDHYQRRIKARQYAKRVVSNLTANPHLSIVCKT